MRVVLLNDTRVAEHHGGTAVVEAILRLGAEAGMSVIAAVPTNRDWRDDPAARAAIDEADLILVNGEGTIHHDAERGRMLLTAGAYARARGKKAALINATWQANGGALAALARDFDLVSVREGASAAELRAAGVDCRVTPDLALLWDGGPASRRAGVTYTDNVVAHSALGLYRQGWRLKGEPLSLFYGRRSPLRSARKYLSASRPLTPAAVALALRGARADWAAQVSSRAALTARLAGSRLVITGRFHIVIFCLATGTPFLAAPSNTHKIEATVADAGLGAWRMTPPDRIDAALIERACEWRDDEPARLDAFVDGGRASMRRLFADLRAL